ncbi:unnamed protein product [Lota lota]
MSNLSCAGLFNQDIFTQSLTQLSSLFGTVHPSSDQEANDEAPVAMATASQPRRCSESSTGGKTGAADRRTGSTSPACWVSLLRP